MKLTKIERNILFDKIVNSDLSPHNFYLVNKNGDDVVKVKGVNYYFKFLDYRPKVKGKYTASRTLPNVNQGLPQTYVYTSWDQLVFHFVNWLVLLKPELIEPDKWKDYQQRTKNIKFDFDHKDNSPFTYSEIEGLRKSVIKLKAELTLLKLRPADLKLLNNKLDYLVEKSKTMGRMDWKELFVGAILGKIVELALPPETANSLWMLIGKTFKTIFILALNQ